MEKSLAIKIVGILFYVLFGVSLVLGVTFYIKNNADMLLYWTYVLAGIATALVLILSVLGIFKSKKSIISSAIVLGAFGALIITCYALSSETMPDFFGADAYKLAAGSLKWIDTGLFMMYALMGAAFIGLVFTEIKSAFN